MLRENSYDIFELEAAKFFEIGSKHSNCLDSMPENFDQHKDQHKQTCFNSQTENIIDQPKNYNMQQRANSRKPLDSLQLESKNSVNESKEHKEIPMYKQSTSNKIRKNNKLEHKHKYNPDTMYHKHSPNSSELGSTSSLPSVLSSPSNSPSLVCPHILIQDLLDKKKSYRGRINVSPHTVGLCDICLEDPPARFHPPLDPMFQPRLTKNFNIQKSKFYASDYNSTEKSTSKLKTRSVSNNFCISPKKTTDILTKQKKKKCSIDDSIDFSLDPTEAERLKLSPVVKRSVDFIRQNSTESGRVLIIHENGAPFEKPLRIGITRDEFRNLNQLLDYISTRCFVLGGARYLFHLDGQLVYSVNELKHGSVYIISGSRILNTRATFILKNKYKDHNDMKARSQRIFKPFIVQNKPKTIETVHPNALRRTKSNLTYSERFMKDSQIDLRQDSHVMRSSQPKVCRGANSILNNTKQSPKRINSGKPSFHHRHTSAKSFKDMNTQTSIENMDTKYKKNNDKLISTVDPRRKIADARIEKSVPLRNRVRAKSDLTHVPPASKQLQRKPTIKKSVTFVDMLSIDTDVLTSEEVEKKSKVNELNSIDQETLKALVTSDIGIQVSDSLEGVLIDLPTVSRTRRPVNIGNKDSKPKKFITISEKQLSNEEMQVLNDLDRGDHVRRGQVSSSKTQSKLKNGTNGTAKDNAKEDEEPFIVDRTGTIAIGSSIEEKLDEKWEYVNQSHSFEQLVDQNEANDRINARVATPSSSSINSSSVENTSLTLSYDSYTIVPTKRKQSMMVQLDSIMERESSRASDTLARNSVLGKERPGANMPTKNMSLFWANGFMINDKVDDSSSRIQINRQSESKDHFIPNPKFHNYIRHSSHLEELVYPIGTLIILYSSWTDSQRFYSGHTTKVSAIFIVDKSSQGDLLNLAVSSQIDNNKTAGCLHVWSMVTLETLMIFTDPDMIDKKVLSIYALFDSAETGRVGFLARDEKRLWLFTGRILLNAEEDDRVSKTMLKTNKILQENQSPLLLLPVQYKSVHSKDTFSLLSFGRRHIQHWLIDEKGKTIKQGKLVNNKEEVFVQAMTTANCIVKLGGNKFIIGQSNGCLTLLILKQYSNESSSTRRASSVNSSNTVIETLAVEANNLKQTQNSESMIGKEQIVQQAFTCIKLINKGLFVTGDVSGTAKFWSLNNEVETADGNEYGSYDANAHKSSETPTCSLLNSVLFPYELGACCSIMIALFQQKKKVVTFYLVSTSNAIVLGTVQLNLNSEEENSRASDCPPMFRIIYEGHESPVTDLATDFAPVVSRLSKLKKSDTSDEQAQNIYFTCSHDHKVCRWSSQTLVWESILPSACNSLAIHPNGFVLVIGSLEGTVYIVDKVSGLLISYFSLVPTSINCLRYSYDGSLLLAGCANGSIFMLPVQNRGLNYKKVSIFQSPDPVLDLQFSADNRYILTSVSSRTLHDMILWDIPNFRYMRHKVASVAEQIEWIDSTCMGTDDVRGIRDNANIRADEKSLHTKREVLCCGRLLRSKSSLQNDGLVVSGDSGGFVRLFAYPCRSTDQGFFEFKQTSALLHASKFFKTVDKKLGRLFVTTSTDGSILMWKLSDVHER